MKTLVVALTSTEQNQLHKAEAIIERGKSAFVEVGLALTEIRDSKLYRDGYGTFEEYCQKRWGFSRPRAYELIGAAKVVENLSAMADTPETERQARPLTKLKPADQPKAWSAAVGRAKLENRPVTAKDVEAQIKKVNGNSHTGRAAWELNKIPAPQEHAPEDQDSAALINLKRYWRKASRKDRSAFLKWVKKAKQ